MNQINPVSSNLNRSWEESQQIIKNLEAEVLKLKAEKETQSCRCHIIDPAKMRILLWINRHKNGKPDTCVLKIAEQRLLGLPRSDRRGETYWRFDELLEKKEVETTPQTSFKCDECKAEVIVISDDYKEAIKQRAQLKKELAAMEPVVKETKAEPQAKPQTQTEKTSELSEKKQKRELLKAQIAQAIKENEQAEKEKQAQENATKQTNVNQ